MVFKAPDIPEPESAPSPTDQAIRRSAEAARRRRVRGGRASTILTGAGRQAGAAPATNPSVGSAMNMARNGNLGAGGGGGGGFAALGVQMNRF